MASQNDINSGIGRRNFLQKMALISGIAVVPSFLSACGDNTATSIPAAAATTTTAATTTAATTTTAAATTAAAATTTAPAATTAPASNGSAAPAGFDIVGPVSNFKADADPAAFTVNSKKGFVYNKAGEYFVFSNICTHKGCEVPYKPDQNKFACPCHGSQYDKTGEVIKGPAPARLPKYEYKVVGDNLYAKVS